AVAIPPLHGIRACRIGDGPPGNKGIREVARCDLRTEDRCVGRAGDAIQRHSEVVGPPIDATHGDLVPGRPVRAWCPRDQSDGYFVEGAWTTPESDVITELGRLGRLEAEAGEARRQGTR